MDFQFSTAQAALQQRCERFALQHIAPYTRKFEAANQFPTALFKTLAQEGLLGLCIPRLHGGAQADAVSYALAIMAMARADAGVATGIAVTNMAAEAISRFGHPAQKRKYLPRISSGEFVSAAFALTEKEAGSDPGSLQTRALPDPGGGDYFILEGAKTFITSGDSSGVILVVARTDADAPKPEFTTFLVEPSFKGFSVTEKMEKMGQQSSSTVSLKFDRCRLHKSQMLGRPGQGLKIALGTLDSGRIGVAAQSVGLAEAAYDAATAYALKRHQFGKPLAQLPAISFKLADMAAQLDAARLLTLRAAWLKDKRRPYLKEASIAKLFATEACNRIVSEAVQIHGGLGYSREHLVEKYYRDARVTMLYEGTSEIQRLVIGREIIKERQSQGADEKKIS